MDVATFIRGNRLSGLKKIGFLSMVLSSISCELQAEQVYITDSSSTADVQVRFTKNKNEVDCWVYKGDLTIVPDLSAIWIYPTQSETADKWVFITDNRGASDPPSCLTKR